MTDPYRRYCPGCGREAPSCDREGRCLAALDPPRFCLACGRRLVVKVFPAHVESRCPAGCGGFTAGADG